jgi:hypothetical protein
MGNEDLVQRVGGGELVAHLRPVDLQGLSAAPRMNRGAVRLNRAGAHSGSRFSGSQTCAERSSKATRFLDRIGRHKRTGSRMFRIVRCLNLVVVLVTVLSRSTRVIPTPKLGSSPRSFDLLVSIQKRPLLTNQCRCVRPQGQSVPDGTRRSVRLLSQVKVELCRHHSKMFKIVHCFLT